MKKNQTYLKGYILCFFALSLFLCSTIAFGATIHVPEDYSTIQAAIDAADPGDTIEVADGIYAENVDVYKQVTIRSENGYNSTTVVAVNSDDDVFEVVADYVAIEGFTCYGATGIMRAGIHLGYKVEHCRITYNRCGYDDTHRNHTGILVYSTYSYPLRPSNNTLIGNICSANGFGIYIGYISNNILSGNTCSDNGYGIYVSISDNNTLLGNNCHWNSNDGIWLANSNNNTLSGNTCTNNGSEGITLSISGNNTLSSNYCCWNYHCGVTLYSSSNNNTLSDNTCSGHSQWGIRLIASSNNIISHNTFSENDYGISLSSTCNGNSIYLNNFGGNTAANVSSIPNSTNIWHSPTEINYAYNGSMFLCYLGNYYNDNTSPDADGDGITDDPYDLPGDEPDDEYPLAATSDNYTIIGYSILDSDEDGVIDQWDICPETPSNSYVNKRGCTQELKGDFDCDGDVDGADLAVFAGKFGKTH